MRILGTLAVLVLVVAGMHGAVTAAEPVLDSPAASPAIEVNPICVQAFAVAEVTGLSQTRETAVDDRLDDSIRACGSLIDWTVGALLHPGAAGEIEPIRFLHERCNDAAAGLAAYATCRSLQAALEETAEADVREHPTEAAEPTPLPTPALPSPAPTPQAPARSATQVSAKPGPGGRVKLPRRLRATVPGATRIRYFDVSGRSAFALVKQTLRRAAPHCGVHNALACVDLTWHVETTQRVEAGACTIVDASTSVASVVYLPRWTKPNRVEAGLLAWWRRVLADSARHEARHIKILHNELGRLRQRLIGRPCGSIDRIIDRANKRTSRTQATFDRRESAKPLPPAP